MGRESSRKNSRAVVSGGREEEHKYVTMAMDDNDNNGLTVLLGAHSGQALLEYKTSTW